MIVLHIFHMIGNAATASKGDPENSEHSKLGESYRLSFGGDAKEGAVGKAMSVFTNVVFNMC